MTSSANYEDWNFFKVAEPALKHPTPLSRSITLLLQLFSVSLINWSWNQAKSASYCLFYAHSSQRWKMAAFPETIAMTGRAMSSWPIIKSRTDNAQLWCWPKNKQKRPPRLLKNAACSHFLRMDEHVSLPFMQPINIFSGTSAIPQPRSNTACVYACSKRSCRHVKGPVVPVTVWWIK